MATGSWCYGGFAVIACFLLSASEADACVVITWGDTINHVGNVPPQNRQNLGATKVGYKYSYFGVFWLDLWTWDGTYCIYDENRYRPIQPENAARLIGMKQSDLSAPLLYHVPLGWFILGPLILLGIITRASEGRPDRATRRYQKALDVLKELVFQPGSIERSRSIPW
jgi:hypothetical protein